MSKKWKILVWILVAVFIFIAAISAIFTNYSKEMVYPTNSITLSTEKGVPGIVDRALREMELANIAFNTPSSLNIDDASQLHLVLSLGNSIDQLKTFITEEGAKYGATIKVSNRIVMVKFF